MASRQYRFRFYLNARHSIKIEDSESRVHPHTWEMVVYITKMNEDVFLFTHIENYLQAFISEFEGKVLNSAPPFDSLTPTMENIGEYFYGRFRRMLGEKSWVLNSFEISENPSRSYLITDGADDGIGLGGIGTGGCGGKPENKPENDQKLQASGAAAQAEAGAIAEEAGADAEAAGEAEAEAAGEAAEGAEEGEAAQNKKKLIWRRNWVYLCAGLAFALAAAAATLLWINRSGSYPWGSDGWGHIFKAELLYKSLQKGDPYPLYTDSWYNGTQPFRYWAPLPYYIIALFLFISKGNVSSAYNLFTAFIQVLGMFGWLLWGLKTGRKKTAFVLGLLWFFMPDNLRVFFSEGNYPRVAAYTVFPYVLLGFRGFLDKKSRKYALGIAAGMLLITLSHAMAAAMAGVTLAIYALISGMLEKKLKTAALSVCFALLGILSAGIWLFPALKGGVVSLDPQAVYEAMKQFTHPAAASFNPLLRFTENRELFYFGLPVVIIALLGTFFSGNKAKSAFITVILVFAGTTTAFLPLFEKLPMGQLLWMERFTPFALAVFFAGALDWESLRKQLRVAFILLVAADCLLSAYLLAYNVNEPELRKDLAAAVNIASSRIAVLDLSTYGSFPAYYISSDDKGKNLTQVFGWASQGASTMPEIVGINTALEKGWYPYLLDRCVQLGADTLFVRRDKLADEKAFIGAAGESGYVTAYSSEENLVMKLPENGAFGTIPRYRGLAVGKFAVNLTYMFPQIKAAESVYIDDYSEEELSRFSFIYLSGFGCRDKAKAEQMIIKLSEKGIKVMVELTEGNAELQTARPGFLGVSAQPVTFDGRLPALDINGGKTAPEAPLPQEDGEWRTVYIENLDRVYGASTVHNQDMPFLGSKINDNIIFIGFNLPYYALETKDRTAVGLLENLTGFSAGQLPERKIVPIRITRDGNHLNISAGESGVVTGIAALDAFRPGTGSFGRDGSLVKIDGTSADITVTYPYLWEGLLISLIGISGYIAVTGWMSKGGGL